MYVRVIFQYSAERFKLWESRDNRQLSDRLGVRVTIHIGLHLLNCDGSQYCWSMYYVFENFILESLYVCVCICLSSLARQPSEKLHSPSSAERHITLLFFRLQPAAYIKCLKATKILSSCVSTVTLWVSSVHLTSLRLLLFHAALIDETAGFRNYTTQHSSMCIPVFKAVPRLTFYFKNIRMWF